MTGNKKFQTNYTPLNGGKVSYGGRAKGKIIVALTQEMEKLQTKLFEAATQGSICSLLQLLEEDPLILDRAVVNCFNETPLHVAAILGHIEFVKEIIRLKPQLVHELNLQQSSPLHLASAKGHVEVMRALLSVDGGVNACFALDRNTRTPLHLAAAKGRVEGVKMLVAAQPDAARVVVNGGENILHLCVKHYQLEALKLLVEAVAEFPEFINSRDVDGNTLLHLAVADKQVETTKYLVSVGAVEVNALNKEGMTAMDVLIRSRRDVRDSEIEKSLKQGRETNNTAICRYQCSNIWDRLMNQPSNNLEQKKNTLMIVAILIATMAFQVGVNPPGGVWQQDEHGRLDSHRHIAGFSVMARNNPVGYRKFYIVNTIALVASLSIILLLISGLPLRRRLFMWILTVISWVAIIAIGRCYTLAAVNVTPSFEYTLTETEFLVTYLFWVWIILMALLIFINLIRMIVKSREEEKHSRGDA